MRMHRAKEKCAITVGILIALMVVSSHARLQFSQDTLYENDFFYDGFRDTLTITNTSDDSVAIDSVRMFAFTDSLMLKLGLDIILLNNTLTLDLFNYSWTEKWEDYSFAIPQDSMVKICISVYDQANCFIVSKKTASVGPAKGDTIQSLVQFAAGDTVYEFRVIGTIGCNPNSVTYGTHLRKKVPAQKYREPSDLFDILGRRYNGLKEEKTVVGEKIVIKKGVRKFYLKRKDTR